MTPREVAECFNAQPVGEGQWEARCPAHDDKQASLSIGTGDDGRVLVKCHAGCDTADVLAAVGLQPRDLFNTSCGSPVPPPPQLGSTALPCLDDDEMKALSSKLRISGKANGTAMPKSVPVTPNGIPKPPKVVTLAQAVKRSKVKGAESDHWLYHDQDGREVAAVVRFETPKGKTYRQYRKDGPTWEAKSIDGKRPLYGLPQVITSNETVYVVEGEKAAGAARELGLLATTSMQGSQSPSRTDWSPLAGRDVVILPDQDAAGGKYAECVQGLLAGLSPKPTLWVVNLPGLPDKGDIVEYIEARREAGDDIATIRAQVEALVADAEPVKVTTTRTSRPNLVCMADVVPEEVRWLWPGRIPLGRATLLVGRPGEGKSFFTSYLAANVSQGRQWIDGSPCSSGSVVLCSAEDGAADTIAPRLIAHDADRSRIHLLDGVMSRTGDGSEVEQVFTLADLPALRETLEQVGDCRLIVVDPIGSYLGGRTDAHRDNEVRGVLAPVCQLADEYDAALLVVAHTRKSAAAHADDMAMGSRAFTGLARSVLHLMADPDDDTGKRRLLLPGKQNLGEPAAGLAFDIGPDPQTGAASIRWHDGEVTITADEAVNRDGAKATGDSTALGEAESYLRMALSSGPRPSKDVMEEGREVEGIAEKTMRRAMQSLEVKPYRSENPGPWWWRLPGDAGAHGQTVS